MQLHTSRCAIHGWKHDAVTYLPPCCTAVPWQTLLCSLPAAAADWLWASIFPAILENTNCTVGIDVPDKPAQHWVPRIRLYFLSEDPSLYARRVATAHQARKEAVHAMRYHLCVDSMPADDMHSLSVEQINRVLTLALNSKFLRVGLNVDHQLTCAHPWTCAFICVVPKHACHDYHLFSSMHAMTIISHA